MRRVLAAEGLGGRGWSDGDLPILDEARALLDGSPPPHGHVIVDEAQDLTPMQLRMLARRTTGAMTILGDIAQAAGPIAYHRWDDLMPHLADGREAEVEELRLAYRVPRQVMELALPLLPLIAPDVAPPIAYRDGDEPPRFVAVEAGDLDAAVVREAAAEAEREGRTAVIASRCASAGGAARRRVRLRRAHRAAVPGADRPRQRRDWSSTAWCSSSPQRSSRRASESTACARSTSR